jgi:hypothetical protein
VERFDKEHSLHVQDEIVGRLSRSVGIQLIRTEAARGSGDGNFGNVLDLVMRARGNGQFASTGIEPRRLGSDSPIGQLLPEFRFQLSVSSGIHL